MPPIFLFLLTMVPGTMLLSAHDIALKRLLSSGVPERILVALMWGGAGVIFSLILFVAGVPEITHTFWRALAISSLLNIFGQFAWYRAFREGDVSVVAPLRLLVPPLVIVTGFLFLREVPNVPGVVGILVTIAGLWFLLDAGSPDGTLKNVLRSRAVHWGLAGAVSFSLSFPFDKQAVTSSSALYFASFAYLIVALGNVLLHRTFNGDSRSLAATLRSSWPALLVGIIFLTSGAFLALHALNFALVAYASSVKRLQALWSVLLSGAILKEGRIVRKLLATVVMLAGVAITVVFG